MAPRPPLFELHIKPLFRLLDRQHMLRVRPDCDLWSYDSVKTLAARIQQKVGGPNPTMPTEDSGGAWPPEWVALFDRWVSGGCRRLPLGTGKDYKLTKQPDDRYLLSCKVDIPDNAAGDSSAWLDVVDPGPAAAVYQLYVFPGEAFPPPTDTIEITCRERVEAAAAIAGVTVIDAAGKHSVQIPVA